MSSSRSSSLKPSICLPNCFPSGAPLGRAGISRVSELSHGAFEASLDLPQAAMHNSMTAAASHFTLTCKRALGDLLMGQYCSNRTSGATQAVRRLHQRGARQVNQGVLSNDPSVHACQEGGTSWKAMLGLMRMTAAETID
jgi:hypothetical protein